MDVSTLTRPYSHLRLAVAAALLIASCAIGAAEPAFAQNEDPYPGDSIFRQPQLPAPPAALATEDLPPGELSRLLSPRDPREAPQAGNVSKPSNRDPGNLSAQRWQDYQGKVNTLPPNAR
jgi:hypothetical protein